MCQTILEILEFPIKVDEIIWIAVAIIHDSIEVVTNCMHTFCLMKCQRGYSLFDYYALLDDATTPLFREKRYLSTLMAIRIIVDVSKMTDFFPVC